MRIRFFIAVMALMSLMAPKALWAQSPHPDVSKALEELQRSVTGEVQNFAYELMDRWVWEWSRSSPFASDTRVVLTGISVPMGFNSQLETQLENHLFDLLLHHPETRIIPVHCPACSAFVTEVTPQKTFVSRGVDSPSLLKALGSTAQAGMTLDFEAEGPYLVMRVRLFSLDGEQKILAARRYAISADDTPFLQDPSSLKSTQEARKDFEDAALGRLRWFVGGGIESQIFAKPSESIAALLPPFFWVTLSLESFVTARHDWKVQLQGGSSSLNNAHDAWYLEGRLATLLTGRTPSFVRPDLWIYASVRQTSVTGPDAVAFRGTALTQRELLDTIKNDNPRTSWSAWGLGLELRLLDRLSLVTGFGASQQLKNLENAGSYFAVGPLTFQTLSLGVEAHF